MAKWLKQSTATTIVVGPIVDSVDATAETGLTISQGDVLLWKEGGTTLGAKNESTSATHRSNGLYTVPLDATDTGTLGQLIVNVAEAGTMVFRDDYLVLPAQVYNSLVLGTDKLQTDVVELNSSIVAAATQALVATACITGKVFNDGGTYAPTNSGALVFYSDDVVEATADHYNGRVVIFTSGAMLGQALAITDYAKVASYGKFTCSVATELPADDVTFVVV